MRLIEKAESPTRTKQAKFAEVEFKPIDQQRTQLPGLGSRTVTLDTRPGRI
jgi:hypothetical protein